MDYIKIAISALIAAALITTPASAAQSAGPGGNKYVALTFDDGPHPVYTGPILDILEEKGAKATFFVVGFRAERHPEVLRRMVRLGCEIGNHTWSHADLSKLSDSAIRNELEKTSDAIRAAAGVVPALFRPPYGSIRTSSLPSIPMQETLWTVDSRDWVSKNAAKVTAAAVNGARNGDIILLHDFYASTRDALPGIIDGLRERGFTLVTVSTLRRLEKLGEVSISRKWHDHLYVPPAAGQ